MTNPHEELARHKKAAALARMFRQCATVSGTVEPSCIARLAESFPLQAWSTLAAAAGVKPPSPATLEIVLHSLRTEDTDADHG